MSITEEQKNIVRSTAPLLKENGKEITSIFYKHMFADHPDLLDIFNQTNQKVGTQPLALANTIYFAAENIDQLDVLMPQIMLIAHKHRALTVRPEHYPIVGKYFLAAVREFVGDKCTQELIDAWAAAYGIIAQIFIDIEQKLYNELGPDEQGFVPFTIVAKEQIASGPIVTLTLERPHGEKLRDYHPGQYITVRIKKDGHFHNRHYSLVEPFNSKSYRVAIKEEVEREPKGVVSTEIIDGYEVGDTILASLPAGTFQLVDEAKHHLFIAGGIGITVVSSMIQQLHKQGKANTTTLIQCSRSKEHAAFSQQLQSIMPTDGYYLLRDDQHQLLDKELLLKVLKPDTHVYICGSAVFMHIVEDYLSECGHPSAQVHTEAFQPSLSVIKGAVKDKATTKSL